MSGGFIYVINHGGFCKIGFSCRPDSRIECITRQLGINEFDYFISEHSENARDIEGIVHYEFVDNNIGGEWFDADYSEVTNAVVSAIKTGYDRNLAVETKKPRVGITPNTLSMLKAICAKREKDLPFLDNRSQVLKELITTAYNKECK